MKTLQCWYLRLISACALAGLALCSGCSHVVSGAAERNLVATTALSAATYLPTTALEQIYYLGVFDPQEQLPPTLYRVRVKGQSSFINWTRYASGWVPAAVIDSLSTSAKFENNKDVSVNEVNDSLKTALTGRRLVLFGPEGFREAPKDYRLVIVMGSSPDKFFQAVDEALGSVASVTQGNSGPILEQGLLRELLRVQTEHGALEELLTEASTDRAKELLK